jgi:hypothetical protein
MAMGTAAAHSNARTHAFFSKKYQYTSERKGARRSSFTGRRARENRGALVATGLLGCEKMAVYV